MDVCDLATQWQAADGLRAALRSHTTDCRRYLGQLSLGSHLDPLGSFFAAIAMRQPDRLLAPLWWSLLELPDTVPVRHLLYGMVGLQYLKQDDDALRGRFDPQIAKGLIVAGHSLWRITGEGRISTETARRTLVRLGRRVRASYPKAAWWQPHLAPASYPEPLRSWLLDVFPEFVADTSEVSTPAVSTKPLGSREPRRDVDIERWRELSMQLRAGLSDDPNFGVRREARALLDEQRSHAERTGESRPLVQTLCSLSSVIWQVDPSIAVEWADEARRWEPWDPYTWTTLLVATRARNGPIASLRVGLEAIERVPHSQAAWHHLAENLAEVRCYAQAEEAFYTEFDRFRDIRASTSLGYVMLSQGQAASAESWFTIALGQSAADSRALRGMAIALQLLDRTEEAIGLLADALDTASRRDAAFLWDAYVSALRAAGREADSSRALSEARAKGLPVTGWPARGGDPRDARLFVPSEDGTMLIGQAKLLRRAARRKRGGECGDTAHALLDAAAAVPGWTDQVAAESVRLLVDTARFTEAEQLARSTLSHATVSLPLWHAFAQIGVERARTQEERFADAQLAELRSPYRKLVELNSATRPVGELGGVRAALSLRDGRAADNEARKALRSIVDWPVHADDREPRRWWQARVREVLIDDSDDAASAVDIAAARERALSHAEFLGDLEEDFVLQATG